MVWFFCFLGRSCCKFSIELLICMFFFYGFLSYSSDKTEKSCRNFHLSFQNQTFPQLRAWIFPSETKATPIYLETAMQWKKSWIWIFASESWQSQIVKNNFDLLLFLKSDCFITIGFTSSTSVIIDNFLSTYWIYWLSHNQQHFHDRPKSPRKATAIVVLSIFELIIF